MYEGTEKQKNEMAMSVRMDSFIITQEGPKPTLVSLGRNLLQHQLTGKYWSWLYLLLMYKLVWLSLGLFWKHLLLLHSFNPPHKHFEIDVATAVCFAIGATGRRGAMSSLFWKLQHRSHHQSSSLRLLSYDCLTLIWVCICLVENKRHHW